MRRTKIVATIGPSSNSPEVLRALVEAGMDVARLNFSHGTHEGHRDTCHNVRRIAEEMGKAVGVMVDLQGPKIRTGKLKDGAPVQLVPGESVCITTRDVEGDASLIATSYEALPRDVAPGNRIYLSDGVIELLVERVAPPDVHCRVVHGGFLGEHKGINLPGVHISAPTLTEKDINDLRFGLTLDIDFVALSFVRTADDVSGLRKRIRNSGKSPSIIAKIERPEALHDFTAILDATDAVMLARGDLGVEVPLNQVPQIQKKLIGQCNDLGVPVIIATQMMESMITSPRPTRAEVADVANAIYDGADALMLSGETANGQFPVQAVRLMADIAATADQAMAQNPTYERIVRMRQSGIRKGKGAFGDAIGQAACRTADAVGAVRIVCFTKMGYTAGLIARYRPSVPITAITLSEEARRRCSLIWGVDALRSIEPCDTDELDRIIDDLLLSHNLAKPGDTVVVAGGMPLAMRTRTNMLKLHSVGDPSWRS